MRYRRLTEPRIQISRPFLAYVSQVDLAHNFAEGGIRESPSSWRPKDQGVVLFPGKRFQEGNHPLGQGHAMTFARWGYL